MNEENVTEQDENASESEGAALDVDQEVTALQTQLTEAETKAQENWDQLLRTKAEMENLRRRNERDVENARKYALENFVKELLPVRDSLEMGLAAVNDTDDNEKVAKLREGKELTLKMLTSVFEKFGVTEINPLDQPFNPEWHQAMSMLESKEKAPNTVLNVMQKGYLLNERLVRPAMVVVSKAAADQDTGGKVDEKA
jgi:molecular chaperone GrpE